MIKSPAELAEELHELPPSSAIDLRIQGDSYFDAIRGIVDIFAPKMNVDVIYITVAIPSHSIIDVLKILEIDLEHIYFVDCVSHIMIGATKKYDNVFYVESPTMLENIMLKVEYLMRKTEGRNSVIILDAINALGIHNNMRILSEFLHIMINNLRAKDAYSIVFTMDELGDTEEVHNMMKLVCDTTITIGGE
ncbi:MAG: hypothetical protein KAS67_00560 [Thermoplasmata archaeon]|nr:hypothetical protein [Thermoplasmata archaeon]